MLTNIVPVKSLGRMPSRKSQGHFWGGDDYNFYYKLREKGVKLQRVVVKPRTYDLT